MSASEFDELRPLLFSIAYRMLARVADAEDVVQDAFLRHQRALADGVEIESPKAYLSAVVTRLAIDQLRSARHRRETYVGQWLPEPLLTDENDPARATEEADSLSMAFLLVLERLSPVERAIFLLHDVFAYDYDEIAVIVDKSAANCRQLAVRARRHVEAEKPRFEASRRARDELAARFFAAVSTGDMDGLVAMLADDVVVYGDGGGKAPQWSQPIVGPDRVSRLFVGLGRQIATLGITIEPHQVNGQPGALLRDRNALLINVFVLDIAGGVIQAIRSVINPDKLHHLGPVADARALAREARRT
jgi:RNA polymerase sigma-70 factor, ECF subfamily